MKHNVSIRLAFSVWIQCEFTESYIAVCDFHPIQSHFYLPPIIKKMAGDIVLGSVSISIISGDVLPYISVTIKASVLKFNTWNICKNNIAKMFLLTSLAKGGYVFGSVGLSVCLFDCGQHYAKSYEWIRMKFYGGVLGSTLKNWLNFGGDLDLLRWVNEPKKPHHNSCSMSRSWCR